MKGKEEDPDDTIMEKIKSRRVINDNLNYWSHDQHPLRTKR